MLAFHQSMQKHFWSGQNHQLHRYIRSALPFTQSVFLPCGDYNSQSLQKQSWISCVFLLSSIFFPYRNKSDMTYHSKCLLFISYGYLLQQQHTLPQPWRRKLALWLAAVHNDIRLSSRRSPQRHTTWVSTNKEPLKILAKIVRVSCLSFFLNSVSSRFTHVSGTQVSVCHKKPLVKLIARILRVL